MAEHRLTFPTDEEHIRELRAGDSVARRRPHRRDPRPHADPHVRPRAASGDGPRAARSSCTRRRTSARSARGATRRCASARRRARAWCASRSRSVATTACARSAARAGLPDEAIEPMRRLRDGVLRDRRRRGGARDDPDRGDRGGRVGGPHARVPVAVPREGLRPADRRDRLPRHLALPRRPGSALRSDWRPCMPGFDGTDGFLDVPARSPEAAHAGAHARHRQGNEPPRHRGPVRHRRRSTSTSSSSAGARRTSRTTSRRRSRSTARSRRRSSAAGRCSRRSSRAASSTSTAAGWSRTASRTSRSPTGRSTCRASGSSS